MKKRIAEVDMLRGVAIVMMIVYHFLYYLDWFELAEFAMDKGGFLILARVIQFLFLGLVGVSVFLSKRDFMDQFERGLIIFWFGMLISLVSYIMFGDFYVKFGILHLIGLSVPIVVFFKDRSLVLQTVFAFGVAVLGWWFAGITVSNGWLFWLGLKYGGFSSLDYFPIFPWFSVVLIGLIVAEIFKKHMWRIRLPWMPKSLIWAGRHALVIYLLHIPIVYGTVWLFVLI